MQSRHSSFHSRTSRHASQVSSRSMQIGHFNPFGKKLSLPAHVQDVLYAKQGHELNQMKLAGQGLYLPSSLLPALDRKIRQLPWERSTRLSSLPSKSATESTTDLPVVRSKTGFGRHRKVTQHSTQMGPNKYLKLYEVIDSNEYGKIAFTNSNETVHPTPSWVTHRLGESCRSARFSLPSDYRRLENMTPLEYLEKCTILTPAHRRRYNLLFAKYMDKNEKQITFERLYPALNSMFADKLGMENFEILCTSLFIERDFKTKNKEQFAGICTLTERLFWSSYLESQENTFFILGQNRSMLECADFSGLQWKLHDLNISVEMRLLLFSLA